MATLLFSLRNVPDDEADEIRALLDQHGVDWYETPASVFGISAGAIWLRDDSAAQEAKLLLDNYQAERFARQREQHQQSIAEGRGVTLAHAIREHPLQFLVYLIAIAVVLYFSIKPFFGLGQ
ncbi:MAG: hypothetical protein JSW10_02470 [Pseudomonadota bacterium]|nr:MAG: hypothetical protein JSW10_02470 [Pseudomonadota bacterium]